ncbi:hypothetical protein Leryth_021944 [Lithospermum erythrorhizon]|nr:hypothetical protein Leryth_021944 [Lithospermum erythrorhizon]
MQSRRCAVCKHFRRRCPSDCIFSPYFPPNDPQRFTCVHEIYGAANIGKILQQVPIDRRAEAVDSMYFEAQCRKNDKVYGSVGVITRLQQEIFKAQSELAKTQAEIAFHNVNDYNNNTNVEQTTKLEFPIDDASIDIMDLSIDQVVVDHQAFWSY